MHKDISRRDMIRAMGLGAAALAAAELGHAGQAWAEDAFTIASTGGSWGEGLKQAYVVNAGFEKRFNVQASYAHMRHPFLSALPAARRETRVRR